MRQKGHRHAAAGAYLAELVIALPVLVLCIFGGIEANSHIGAARRMITAKREAVVMAFHGCSIHYEHTRWQEMDRCLRREAAWDALKHAEKFIGDVKLIFSFYVKSAGGIERAAYFELSSNPAGFPASQSRFNAVLMADRYADVFDHVPALLVVELYGKPRTVLGRLLGWGAIKYDVGMI